MPNEKIDERLVRAVQYAIYQHSKGKNADAIMELLERALEDYLIAMDGRVGRA